MCGICGIVGAQSAQTEILSVVQNMMEKLAHRGPDDEGLEATENFVFGHRRLSIIDLEHGSQPMTSPDGNLVLVYNGEIYNYIELRQELTRKGVRFRTFSDTEVILHLYQTYGFKCLQKLNGMFAFAIYDKSKQTFFAARDPFGIKPFYYARLPGEEFIFASEIKALFCHEKIRPRLNPEALNEYLTFQFCLGEKTLFKDIYKLEPGHYLIKNRHDEKPKVEKYWDLSYEIDTHHTKEYFIDKLQLLLQDSIRWQLRSDVPIGGYLSGGLDSSTIVTLASLQYENGFKCFTGKFNDGPSYDESDYARIVAADSQCEYHEIIPTPDDFINNIQRLIYYMDEPAAGPGIFPQYLVSKLAKEHVTVVLGGQGGDEIFGGYARYLVAYLEQCLKGGIFETQEEGKFVVTLESIIPNLPLLKQYVPLLKSFWKEELFAPMDVRYFRLIDRSQDLKYILHPDIWYEYNQQNVFESFQKVFNDPQTRSYLNKMTHFDQKTLLPALLQVEDRVSMAVSLESRVPLLDIRIAQLVASMPPTIKFEGGQTKYILKKAVEELVPKTILDRKDKMGFPVPLMEWFNDPIKDFVMDILFSAKTKERGFFNTGGLKYLLNNQTQFGRQLWGALCLELWFEEFLDHSYSDKEIEI